MSDCIYSDIIVSKTGIPIPVLKSGRTVDSRYDPQKESLRQLEQINPDSHFIIIPGAASGILIKTIIENRQDVFVLAVEKSDEELEFLKKLEIIQELYNKQNVEFCTLNTLEQKIIDLYIPAFYGNLQVIEQRGWTTENQDCIQTINNAISKSAGIVSADYSVQCHFGKIWHHNILSNLKHLDQLSSFENFPTNKTALIMAAGPSIDKTIKSIITNKDDYYIIATDTAFSILNSYNIIPQVVVSIDGQNISRAHFLHNSNNDFSQTIFLFDLCANSSAIQKIINSNGKLNFFTSGHPFCEFINSNFSIGLPSLFSGAGTVTISAVDFAVKAGFKNIIVAGADFSYSNGKPYAKGTYLDCLYNQNANKIDSIQKKFSALQYRTQLIYKPDSYTTQILEAYKTSFEQYLQNNNFDFANENNIYTISCKDNSQALKFTNNNINGKQILQELENIYKNKDKTKKINSIFDLTKSDISLLPLISWLRNHDNIKRSDFNYFYEKALLIYTGLGGN